MEISLATIGCSSGGGRHLLLLDFNNVKQPSTAAVNVNRCPCPFSPHSGQSPPLEIIIIAGYDCNFTNSTDVNSLNSCPPVSRNIVLASPHQALFVL